jgi:cysteinyl-tRNA synthetase
MLVSAKGYRDEGSRQISIYSSLGGARVALNPLDKSLSAPKVLVYVCGLTPQDHPHIGHGLMGMRFDMVRRYMLYRGLNVVFVQNVTDIDDKIIAKVLSLGVDPLEMTRRYTDEFYQALGRLHVMPVDRLTKVTEFVPEIIAFIERLIERGFAYATPEGNVYFDVAKKDDYGKLSNQNVSKLYESVRKEVEKDKRSAVDFALWKRDESTSLSAPSPWGVGRPGWHIECSVMIHETLGASIDIHGGAVDLKFPHHENEIAQSEAHSGAEFASIWMHCGLLNIEGQKMSKSLNNFIPLLEGIEMFGVTPLRFAVARAHYRASLDLSDKLMRDVLHALLDYHRLFARVPVARLEGVFDSGSDPVAASLIAEFEEAMDNDFNSPEAMVALDKARSKTAAELDKLAGAEVPELLIRRVALIKELGQVLGLFFDTLETVEVEGLRLAAKALGAKPLTPSEVQGFIERRNAARAAKDFATSDRLRKELNAHGVDVLDSKQGSTWRFA